MADLAITPANVSIPDTTAATGIMTSGEAIDAGEAIYEDTNDDNKAKLAKADASATSTVKGIAVSTADAAGQRVAYVDVDDTVITINGVATKGTQYFLSSNAAGKLCPEADLGSGHYVVPVCVASATTSLTLGIRNTGITKP